MLVQMRHDLALLVFSVWQNQVRLIEEIKVKYFQELVYQMADLTEKAQHLKCHSEVGLLNMRMTHLSITKCDQNPTLVCKFGHT